MTFQHHDLNTWNLLGFSDFGKQTFETDVIQWVLVEKCGEVFKCSVKTLHSERLVAGSMTKPEIV